MPEASRPNVLEDLVLQPLRQALGDRVEVSAESFPMRMTTRIVLRRRRYVVRDEETGLRIRIMAQPAEEYIQVREVPERTMAYDLAERDLVSARDVGVFLREIAQHIFHSWTSMEAEERPRRAHMYGGAITPMIYGAQVITPRWQDVGADYDAPRRRLADDAQKKAAALLESLLDDAQKIDLRERQRIHVRSQKGRNYVIRYGAMSNVFNVIDGGLSTMSYCLQAKDSWLPVEDVMAAQLLLLVADEDRFLSTANSMPLLRPVRF